MSKNDSQSDDKKSGSAPKNYSPEYHAEKRRAAQARKRKGLGSSDPNRKQRSGARRSGQPTRSQDPKSLEKYRRHAYEALFAPSFLALPEGSVARGVAMRLIEQFAEIDFVRTSGSKKSRSEAAFDEAVIKHGFNPHDPEVLTGKHAGKRALFEVIEQREAKRRERTVVKPSIVVEAA